jgi:hypothetical protein
MVLPADRARLEAEQRELRERLNKLSNDLAMLKFSRCRVMVMRKGQISATQYFWDDQDTSFRTQLDEWVGSGCSVDVYELEKVRERHY